MKKITLGNTNTQVSQMALGCLPFGTKLNKELTFQILDFYTEKGGSFLDTANNYVFWDEGTKGGESEIIVGEWLKERKNRDKIFISTKVGGFPKDRDKLVEHAGTAEGWAKYSEGLSKKTIIEGAEQSLKRLGTDYIDLYFTHIDHRADSLEETLEAFNTLVQSGKVKNIGCSNYKTWRMMQGKSISRKNNWAEYAAVQMLHTYYKTRRDADLGVTLEADEGLFDYIKDQRDVSLMAYTPLLWGSYSDESRYNDTPKLQNFKTSANEVKRKVLHDMAAKKDASVNQIIYAWMINQNPPVIPLVAVSSLTQLKENLDSVNITFTEEELVLMNNPF